MNAEAAVIICENPQYMGRLNFVMPNMNIRFHVHVAREFTGTIRNDDKKQPIWVPLRKLNYKLMSMDYPLWLPRMLRGQYVEYYAKANAEGKMISSSYPIRMALHMTISMLPAVLRAIACPISPVAGTSCQCSFPVLMG